MQYLLECILTLPPFLIYYYIVNDDLVQWVFFFHVVYRNYRSLQKEGKSLLQGIRLLSSMCNIQGYCGEFVSMV
jgi:hypothetical protein